MNRKELRYAFNVVIAQAESTKCEELHHPKKWQHGVDELCPALYHLHRQTHVLKEYMKKVGI